MSNLFVLDEEPWIAETDAITGLPITSNSTTSATYNTKSEPLFYWNIIQEDEVDTQNNSTSNTLYDCEFELSSKSEFIFDNFVPVQETFQQFKNITSKTIVNTVSPICDSEKIDFTIGETENFILNDNLELIANEIALNEQRTQSVETNSESIRLLDNDEPPGVLASNSRGYAPLVKVVPIDPRYNAPVNDNFRSELASWLDNNPNTPSGNVSSLSTNIIKSNQALILDPFRRQFEPSGDEGDEANNIEMTLKAAGFVVTRKENDQVTIDDFKSLDKYGVIALVSHGARVDVLSQAAIGNSRYFNNPDRARGRVVVVTGVVADDKNIETYKVDLAFRRLIITEVRGVNYLAITPSFINTYTPNPLPNSLIYVSACDSTYNESLAKTFIEKGAGAFVGYSRVVDTNFADLHGRAMFNALVADRTTGEIPGINVNRDFGGALFRLSSQSATDLTINIGLRNGTFEIDNLSGWVKQGNARAVTSLGPLSAFQGEDMAFISTASSSSSISQKFFVPANAKNLNFSYNLVSEEPSEYVGTMFDDQFDVLLNPAPTSSNPNPNQTTIVKATINTSTWLPINGINFPGGDNTTFETGFITKSFDLTPFQGQEIDLMFRVFDRGDAAFTTAALIDNIQITTI